MAIISKGLDNFKANFRGGARPSLFQCFIEFPTEITSAGGGNISSRDQTERNSFMIKAASLPSDTMSVIEVPFRGRKFKVPGDRTFEPWTITVINDIDFSVRNGFEAWMNAINEHKVNRAADAFTGAGALNYMKPMSVVQLDRNQNTPGQSVVKEYQFVDCFPTNISAIDLAWENADAVEEFTVEIQYQYWLAGTANEGQTTTSTGSSAAGDFNG